MFRLAVFNNCLPISRIEWTFFVGSIVMAILAFSLIHHVYRMPGPTWLAVIVAYVTGLCISFIPVQAIAYYYEHREIWRVGQHSAIFFWGDMIGLPSIAAGFVLLRRSLKLERPVADRLSWRIAVIGGAIAISTYYHLSQADEWSRARLHVPSKDWHDFFVYPIFLYYLGSQLPFITAVIKHRGWDLAVRFSVAFGLLAIFGGFTFWAWAGGSYDPSHSAMQPLFGFA